MHYIDEGQGKPMLLLHGNPTWSFYYRNMIAAFSSSHRVVVPDHIGCGLSDKPQDYEYTLKQHLYPYDHYNNRIAIARFVADIPMNPNHRSYQTLKNIELSLSKHHCPCLILWGKRDFCFHDYFLHRWMEIYPHAAVKTFESAGHYVLEDAGDEIIKELKKFL